MSDSQQPPPFFRPPTVEANPYAAPQTVVSAIPISAVDGSADSFWDGKYLVVRSCALLPRACVKTGEPLEEKYYRKQTLYYQPGWIYFTLLLGLLPFVIIALIARKRCDVTFGICGEERGRRWMRSFPPLGILALGFALMFYTLGQVKGNDSSTMLLVLSLFLMACGAIWAVIVTQKLSVKKHNDGWFWLSGFGQGFRERYAHLGENQQPYNPYPRF